ncbi:peptide deformylase [Carboxylicivirga taeanensis]|uniref:peptide deformylase n=1 Tax=Carboxylicivirga taeanensis TaxID=1416875 RepID=UPI003F6DC211
MILTVLQDGHPVLRQVAKAITPSYPNLSQLIKDMWSTMYRCDGIGLAAPQVGHSVRLFVIDLDVYKDEHPELKGFKKVFINPQLEIVGAQKVRLSEGCLSLPGVFKKVKRPAKIHISYQNEAFEEVHETYEGFASRVIQHEYDHLEGRLFIDYQGFIGKLVDRVLKVLRGR